MINSARRAPGGSVFSEGDEVVLARGTYTGTPGVFLRSRGDIKWADILERNGAIRSHPVEWLAHTTMIPPDADRDSALDRAFENHSRLTDPDMLTTEATVSGILEEATSTS